MADIFDKAPRLSGIDKLIELAEAAEGEFDEGALEALASYTHLRNDMVDGGTSWGASYLRKCRAEAIEAIKAFATADVGDWRAVLALQNKINDYARVAGFVAELIDRGVEARNVAAEAGVLLEDEADGGRGNGESRSGVQDAEKPAGAAGPRGRAGGNRSPRRRAGR